MYGDVHADLKRMEVMEAKERLPKETKGKAKERDEAWDEVPSVLNKEEVKDVDLLQSYLHLLSPSLIELLRFCETTRARNTCLTREVVLLEKHIVDLQALLAQWQQTTHRHRPVNSPGEGMMPASFRERSEILDGNNEAFEEVLDPDFAKSAIGQVASVNSGLLVANSIKGICQKEGKMKE
ncbi:Neutral/alkaline invertase 1, mitochondrial [Hordeum vulgare]|nr:Neutral/alkaline invertase 1, mitochondrial [Hordeum vulgare]